VELTLSKSDKLLVLTPIQETFGEKENIIFLGSWCNAHSKREFFTNRNHTFLRHPYNVNKKKFLRDQKYLKVLRHRLLESLTKKLNNIHKINWSGLALNYNQDNYNILLKYYDKINWCSISENPYAIDLIENNTNKNYDYWFYLSRNTNPKAIQILNKNIENINWVNLSKNPCPEAMNILYKNQDKIVWKHLSANPNAIKLLENNIHKIDWYHLSSNPNAIHLLKNNLDKISWYNLSSNPNAIDILKDNQEYINWSSFSINPSIFEYDYQNMKKNNENMYEDLIKEVMKPSRIFKNISNNYDYLEIMFDD